MRIQSGAAWGDNLGFGRYEASAGWQTCGSVSEPWASMNTFNIEWVQAPGGAGQRQLLALEE